MCDRGNAKAYFRFHGGIGDGNGRVAYRNTDENTVARPLQLFDDLISFDLKVSFNVKFIDWDSLKFIFKWSVMLNMSLSMKKKMNHFTVGQ